MSKMQRLQNTSYKFYLTVIVIFCLYLTLASAYIFFFLIYFHQAATESKYDLYCELQDFSEFFSFVISASHRINLLFFPKKTPQKEPSVLHVQLWSEDFAAVFHYQCIFMAFFLRDFLLRPHK